MLLNHPPYLALVGNQLAFVGTINPLVLLQVSQSTKQHFERQEKLNPPKVTLKTNYVQTQTSGNVISLLDRTKKS